MEITKENFKKEVLESDKPVLVDFWADWCQPCKMQAPFIDEIEQKYAGKFKVGKLNIDEAQDIAARYSVASIPTLIIFKDGAEAERLVGLQPPDALSEIIDKHL